MNQSNSGIKLVKESFLKDLVVVTGAPTSGKSMLAPIVSSLDRAENFKMSILLEHLGTLHHLGKISEESLVFLSRYIVDFMLYDNMIGRDLNFRFGDETSIWNTTDPEKYFERLLSERGEFIMQEIEEKHPLLIVALSNAFWHAKEWFRGFPFMKMVYIGRHPVDTVYSWYNHRYGEEVKQDHQAKGASLTYGSETYNSKINQVLLTQVDERIVPYYALEWADKHAELSEMDRVIYMIKCIRDNYAKALDSLSEEEKKKVLFLTFNETVSETESVLDKMCSFLETKATPYTSFVLKRENCPRVLSPDDQEEKLQKIKELASEEALSSLMSMVDVYKKTRI